MKMARREDAETKIGRARLEGRATAGYRSGEQHEYYCSFRSENPRRSLISISDSRGSFYLGKGRTGASCGKFRGLLVSFPSPSSLFLPRLNGFLESGATLHSTRGFR